MELFITILKDMFLCMLAGMTIDNIQQGGDHPMFKIIFLLGLFLV